MLDPDSPSPAAGEHSADGSATERLLLRFPPSLEQEFLQARSTASVRQIRFALGLAAVAITISTVLFPPRGNPLIQRSIVPVIALCWLSTLPGWFTRLLEPIMAGLVVWFSVVVAEEALAVTTPKAFADGTFNLFLGITFALTFARIRLAFALPLALIIGLGWILVATPRAPVDMASLFVAFMIGIALVAAVGYFAELHERQEFLLRRELDREKAKSEQLLLNVLPPEIASRLREGEAPIADSFDAVSVLFADIVDFSSSALGMDPRQLVAMLNRLFSRFDDLAGRHGLQKIKTIGDAYGWSA